MASVFGLPQVSGIGSANNGAATASIIAAQGAGKVMRLTQGILSITTAATGGGGLARICDGSSTIIAFDANALGNFCFDLGDIGYPLTANTALQLIVSGAATTQATANIVCVAVVA